MKVILDTNIYLSQSFDFFKKHKSKIIGTKWNAWELITSSRYHEKSFKIFQRAICKYLNYCGEYIEVNPIEELLGDHLQHKRLSYSRLIYSVIRDELARIEQSQNFLAYKNGISLKDFREYDNRGRAGVKNLIELMLKKYEDFDSKAFDKEIAYHIIVANIDELVLDWLWKHHKFIPLRSKIQLYRESPFIEVFLDYLELKFYSGGGAHKNDFNDLMFLVYLTNTDYCYCTTELSWLEIFEKNKFMKNRYIKVEDF